MKALILNSGLGSRMGDIVATHPKCMTRLNDSETIISRQLKLLSLSKIHDVIITTGYFDKILEEYCYSLDLPLNYTFVKNPLYNQTNYIYSILCAKEYIKDQTVILMHGDLVFVKEVLDKIISFNGSCMKISSTLPLPQKDFKALICNSLIKKIGVDLFDNNAVEAQAMYKLYPKELNLWLDKIEEFCNTGKVNCYAENAFNEIKDNCPIYGCDVKDLLCSEVDNYEDLENVIKKLK